jgi:hypothetical protein
MKQLLLVCLLAASSAAIAQNSTAAPQRGGKSSEVAAVELSRADAAKARAEADKKRGDEEKKRAELDAARTRLDKAAREVAQLSEQLAMDSRRDFLFINTDRRAMLGVQVDPESGKEGARVRSVSPGGPAAEAGMQTGDVIVALDGKVVSGGEEAGRALIEQMRTVKPDQKVKVRVLRTGKNKDLVVIARPFAGGMDEHFFRMQMSDMAGPMTGVMGMAAMPAMPGVPMVRQFRAIWPNEFGGMELASITPKLGAYFGATEGVLVVQAPEGGVFKLEDGDVIQSIDGRKPDDGTHALRILRSYQSGEKLNMTVLRQRKPVTLSVTMPERPEMGEFMDGMPPIPVAPPAPPAPPAPGGTDD